jgi:hypothetical protein
VYECKNGAILPRNKKEIFVADMADIYQSNFQMLAAHQIDIINSLQQQSEECDARIAANLSMINANTAQVCVDAR